MVSFMDVIKDLNSIQLRNLCRCGKGLPGVYIFDSFSKTAETPGPGVIPWPVEYLLRHHKKHIFSGNSLHSMEKIWADLANWANKWKWKRVLANAPCENPYWRFKVKNNQTPPCPHKISDRAEKQLQSVIHRIHDAAVHARKEHRRWNEHGNFTMIIKWAINIIREQQYKVLPTDKDGGFAIMSTVDYHNGIE